MAVGFNSSLLIELRSQFNIQYVISDDPLADLNWFAIHELKINVAAPILSREMLDCLAELRSHYAQFVDINSRRYYYVPGREPETYNGFVLTFYKIYEILKSHSIGLILFSNIPHEGFDYILYLVSSYFKIPNVICHQSLIPNRFWIMSSISELGRFSVLPQIFNQERSNYSLPENWFYMLGSSQDSSYGVKQAFFETAKRIHRMPPALIRLYYGREYRYNNARIIRRKNASDRYIYFPLHLQPELTTSSLGGIYADQLLAIETLSAWVPEGYYIYLKENPKQTEKQRGNYFYKRLETLQNVVLLNKDENSIELIRGSVGVATVTGTAGWEALFYNKPVMVFGYAWYREFQGVVEFDPSLDFDEFLKVRPLDRDAIVEQLDQCLTKAGKGVVDPAYAGLVNAYDDHMNAISVVNSLYRYACA